MDWKEWLDLIAKGASTYFGYKDAKNQEKWQMSPADLFAVQNPSSNTPFYNTTADWNRGDPIINRQMSPQLQQAFDEHIWKALAQPPSNYGYNENMDKLKNRAENYQLSRYGQTGTPYVKKPEPTSELRYEPVGSDSFAGGMGQEGAGTILDPDGVGDFDPSMTSDEASYNNLNPNTNPRTYLDEIQQAIAIRDMQERAGNRDFEGRNNWDDASNYWWTGRNTGSEFGEYYDTNTGSGIPYRDQYGGYGGDGTLQGIDWANVMEQYGKDALRMGGNYLLPFLGTAAQQLVDWNSNDYFGQPQGIMHPDSDDYVPSGGDGSYEFPDRQSGFEGFNYAAPTRDSRSISNGYGYATRLPPRGTPDDPRWVSRIDPDKIGG